MCPASAVRGPCGKPQKEHSEGACLPSIIKVKNQSIKFVDRTQFLIVVTVDVILGPLITLAVFNRAKPWTELRRDLVIVALIQLSALGYGLWTVFVARPVHLVFEYDRFRVVHAVEVPPEMLAARFVLIHHAGACRQAMNL
jgi:hypothetical protein